MLEHSKCQKIDKADTMEALPKIFERIQNPAPRNTASSPPLGLSRVKGLSSALLFAPNFMKCSVLEFAPHSIKPTRALNTFPNSSQPPLSLESWVVPLDRSVPALCNAHNLDTMHGMLCRSYVGVVITCVQACSLTSLKIERSVNIPKSRSFGRDRLVDPGLRTWPMECYISNISSLSFGTLNIPSG